MKSDFKVALRLVSTMLFTCILCFFVYISFNLIVKQISTKVIGYDVIDTAANNGNGEKIGYVEELPPPEERGENRTYISVYSEMPFTAKATVWVFQVICGVGVFFCTAGSVVAKVAAKDRNDVDFNKGKYDRWRGVKIGLIAAIPSLIAYALAVLVKMAKYSGVGETYFWIYRWILTTPVKPFVDLLVNNSINLQNAPISGIVWSGIFVPLLVVFCTVMYLICYNEESVIAKLLYKSTRKKDETRRIVRK